MISSYRTGPTMVANDFHFHFVFYSCRCCDYEREFNFISIFSFSSAASSSAEEENQNSQVKGTLSRIRLNCSHRCTRDEKRREKEKFFQYPILNRKATSKKMDKNINVIRIAYMNWMVVYESMSDEMKWNEMDVLFTLSVRFVISDFYFIKHMPISSYFRPEKSEKKEKKKKKKKNNKRKTKENKKPKILFCLIFSILGISNIFSFLQNFSPKPIYITRILDNVSLYLWENFFCFISILSRIFLSSSNV